ncbi:unnamed protein product, partial [Timema podura]|nr:unnamed protein product [Timema podura]
MYFAMCSARGRGGVGMKTKFGSYRTFSETPELPCVFGCWWLHGLHRTAPHRTVKVRMNALSTIYPCRCEAGLLCVAGLLSGLHPMKLDVGCVVSHRRIIGPIFFEDTVNNDLYLEFFTEVMSQLDDQELADGYFQQDVQLATPPIGTWQKFEAFSRAGLSPKTCSHLGQGGKRIGRTEQRRTPVLNILFEERDEFRKYSSLHGSMPPYLVVGTNGCSDVLGRWCRAPPVLPCQAALIKCTHICVKGEWKTILEKPPSVHPTEIRTSISPTIGGLVYCESYALDHATTEADTVNRDGEPLKFGQNFLLSPVETITEKVSVYGVIRQLERALGLPQLIVVWKLRVLQTSVISDGPSHSNCTSSSFLSGSRPAITGPLYVQSEIPQIDTQLGASGHASVRLSSVLNTYCRWRVLYWDP